MIVQEFTREPSQTFHDGGEFSQGGVSRDEVGPMGIGQVWRDDRYRGLERGARELALYCMQGDQTQELGIQKFSPGQAAEDVSLPLEEVPRLLEQVVQAYDWRWDAEKRVLWMVDHPQRFPKLTQTMIRRGVRAASQLPASRLVAEFLASGVPDNPRLDAVWQSAVSGLPSRRRRPSSEPTPVHLHPSPESAPSEPPAVVALQSSSSTLEPSPHSPADPPSDVIKDSSILSNPPQPYSLPLGPWASPWLVGSSPIYDPKFLQLLGLPSEPSPFPKRRGKQHLYSPTKPDKSSVLRAERRKERKRKRKK